MIATTTPLDTTLYKNGLIARNSQTGLYWTNAVDKFSASSLDATLLDSAQAAVIRATYLNVEIDQVATILDELCQF